MAEHSTTKDTSLVQSSQMSMLPCQHHHKSTLHPLPELKKFVQWLEESGVDETTKIVAYDDAGGTVAARLWWMLRCIGLSDVYILEGGWQAWLKSGGASATAPPTPAKAQLCTRVDFWQAGHMPVVDIRLVRDNVTSRRRVVVDSRPADRYCSRGEPVWPDTVSGHIPGALNWCFRNNLTSDGSLRPVEELRAELQKLLPPGTEAKEVIFHCGSGVTACHNIAVMEHVGLGVPALYVGSWSEWSRKYPALHA